MDVIVITLSECMEMYVEDHMLGGTFLDCLCV